MYGPGYNPNPNMPYGNPNPGYGPLPVIREKSRGFGIDPHEYQQITQCAMNIYREGRRPFSTHTGNAIKQMLGGDWAVVCYPEQRPYDFALSTVKGGDFMVFTVDNVLFQVCRLR